ncbi:hypothetical protein [Mucilaginibacter inviolabilis]|nr:hypothetical protein [Mucilaginibacter inviolabilis]
MPNYTYDDNGNLKTDASKSITGTGITSIACCTCHKQSKGR